MDARVVSATNIDIVKAIRDGAFREDLYYRTAVINLHLPPLRERGSDIMLLANLFLRRFCEGLNRKVKGFSTAAADQLHAYEWPGNVRELENRVQRAVIMSDSPLLDSSDLGFDEAPPPLRSTTVEKMTLKDARDRVEFDMITAVLKTQGGNIAKASEELGVSRPTMYDLMKKHGLGA